MRAWGRGLVGIALLGVSGCGGAHSTPPDGPVLGASVDGPLPLEMDGTPDGHADDAAAPDGGVPADPADGGPLTPDPVEGQARPTSMVTSPS